MEPYHIPTCMIAITIDTSREHTVEIRHSVDSDRLDIAMIHTAAFGEKEGPVVAQLALDLFDDASARPLLSLVAAESGRLIGHILFTRAGIAGADERLSVRILAPLAVLPGHHGMGVGGALIRQGLALLQQSGVHLVFVLGHPDYYPRSGFTPAGKAGFEAPYPIPEKDAAAWMVLELNGNAVGKIKGRVECAAALDHPEHWRE